VIAPRRQLPPVQVVLPFPVVPRPDLPPLVAKVPLPAKRLLRPKRHPRNRRRPKTPFQYRLLPAAASPVAKAHHNQATQTTVIRILATIRIIQTRLRAARRPRELSKTKRSPLFEWATTSVA
jgi:hypothetical protein